MIENVDRLRQDTILLDQSTIIPLDTGATETCERTAGLDGRPHSGMSASAQVRSSSTYRGQIIEGSLGPSHGSARTAATIKRILIDTLRAAALVFLVPRLVAEGLCAISVPAFCIRLHTCVVGQLLYGTRASVWQSLLRVGPGANPTSDYLVLAEMTLFVGPRYWPKV
jgi:hypothetical protein